MDKKNQQSKSQYGTLTAKSDANNDYSQGQTTSSVSEYGTMTAKMDANKDYGGKSTSTSTGGQQQSGSKKTQTSDKNIGR